MSFDDLGASRLAAALTAGALFVAAGCGHPASPSSSPASAAASFGLPVNLSQIDPGNSMKVWPYGVQGGDHPNGHPGLDFMLVIGADVRADQSGTISQISSSTYAGETGIDITHADGWTTYITGFFQTISVAKGQKVSQGQVIATAAPFGLGSTGSASFHWQIVDSSKRAYCPADFLPADLRAQVQQLLDQSSYPNKDQFPALCNPCPAGGCR